MAFDCYFSLLTLSFAQFNISTKLLFSEFILFTTRVLSLYTNMFSYFKNILKHIFQIIYFIYLNILHILFYILILQLQHIKMFASFIVLLILLLVFACFLLCFSLLYFCEFILFGFHLRKYFKVLFKWVCLRKLSIHFCQLSGSTTNQ